MPIRFTLPGLSIHEESRMKLRFSALALATATFLAGTAAAQNVDPALPDYKSVSGVSGNLVSIGSDTLNNLMTLWSEGFRRSYPSVAVQIQGAGSGTAPPALIQGTAQFAPMSRPMRGTEIQQFEARYGYAPIAVRGAIDALGVFVHKDNPVSCLSLREIDAIFSSTRAGGANAPITTWGQVGATGQWANRPIAKYGRNSASGTYGYFKEVALSGGDFAPDVREQPGSSTVVQGVAADVNGIGYSGVGYATADVKLLDIKGADGKCYKPNATDAGSGNYPIARFLYIYVNRNPNQQMEPLRAEFIRYVYSKQGQQDVARAGFFPVNKAIADQDLKAFGLIK
jgi:phosphate transport system substrate-binding protein